MTTQTQQPPLVEGARWRFTTDEYHRMIDAGVLGEDDRVELIGGEVVRMAAIGARHGECITDLTEGLALPLAGRARLRIQLPITIPGYDEPEPDVVIARLRPEGYGRSHPGPADVLFLIEVSDSSLSYDRRVKLPIYVRAGIPESWIVDLGGDALERHTDPDPATGAYRTVARIGRGDRLASAVLPDLVLHADAVLGSGDA